MSTQNNTTATLAATRQGSSSAFVAAPLTGDETEQKATVTRRTTTTADTLERVRSIVSHLLLPAAILLTWELLTRNGYIDALFLPRPIKVIEAFLRLFAEDKLALDIQVSATTVIKGFVAGTSIGLLAGFTCGISRIVESLFGPLLNTIRQVPPMAWLPLIVLWIGAGDLAKTIIIGKAVFFPVFLNT
ncbi:MAG: hypothetical protein LBV54_03625, partial [Puniceicoccales bacterium]|nr:hypothetical protein [Puniceicoccales bacterium]